MFVAVAVLRRGGAGVLVRAPAATPLAMRLLASTTRSQRVFARGFASKSKSGSRDDTGGAGAVIRERAIDADELIGTGSGKRPHGSVSMAMENLDEYDLSGFVVETGSEEDVTTDDAGWNEDDWKAVQELRDWEHNDDAEGFTTEDDEFDPYVRLRAQGEEEGVPPLVRYGSASLHRPQKPVNREDIHTQEFKDQLDTLIRSMDVYEGVGIAASQIGWDARVFVMGHRSRRLQAAILDDAKGREEASKAFGSKALDKALEEKQHGSMAFRVWVNPTIQQVSKKTNFFWEGCLSVPGMKGWVERPRSIKVVGYDETGDKREVTLKGIAARVFQHEYDHLDGVLYPDRVSSGRFLVPAGSLNHQHKWAMDFPSQLARMTEEGELGTPLK